MTTIANYVRNIKVFFNYLYEVEREIPKNPVESVENPKVQRKVKKILTAEEIKKGGYIDYAVTDLDRTHRMLFARAGEAGHGPKNASSFM
ncbi:hypothetical protein [Paenibacillus sp. Leaf72]|uniref:hypothetical protein n=1 Tax=Paenibacillus sp. Leaf72 TaxID=1736234 RepID=UPI0006F26A17|nr:hypothetical protein [Paenibacillus sp. Leaf72]KQO17486.1 hypothetical protein ASF12_02010 [Paenibacillus sp. Leaf72]